MKTYDVIVFKKDILKILEDMENKKRDLSMVTLRMGKQAESGYHIKNFFYLESMKVSK